MSKKAMVRIIPAPARAESATPTHGTKVMVGDQEIHGVTRIELVAEVGDIWRARIDCHVDPTDISATARIFHPTLWQRIKWFFRISN